MFSRDDRLIYADPAPGFPFLLLRRDDPMPDLPASRKGPLLSALATTDPDKWLARPQRLRLYAQTLSQQDGYGTTLLVVEIDRDQGREGNDREDLFEGIGRLGWR